MKTNPGELYSLRDMDVAASHHRSPPMAHGWIGRRKNHKMYIKQWRGGSLLFKGGEWLDAYLAEHPNMAAYQRNSDKPIQFTPQEVA